MASSSTSVGEVQQTLPKNHDTQGPKLHSQHKFHCAIKKKATPETHNDDPDEDSAVTLHGQSFWHPKFRTDPGSPNDQRVANHIRLQLPQQTTLRQQESQPALFSSRDVPISETGSLNQVYDSRHNLWNQMDLQTQESDEIARISGQLSQHPNLAASDDSRGDWGRRKRQEVDVFSTFCFRPAGPADISLVSSPHPGPGSACPSPVRLCSGLAYLHRRFHLPPASHGNLSPFHPHFNQEIASQRQQVIVKRGSPVRFTYLSTHPRLEQKMCARSPHSSSLKPVLQKLCVQKL